MNEDLAEIEEEANNRELQSSCGWVGRDKHRG